MTRILRRPLVDRFGALALLATAVGVFAVEYQSGTTIAVVLGVLLLGAAVNAAFILLTPIGIIENSTLCLFSEAQPIIVNLRPQRVALTEVSELQIDKKAIFPRAIFYLPHGTRIYHGFPSRSEQRIQKFLEFIGKDVQHTIAE